ncbi:sugar phosphate nucleotidyltransferase [Prosthecochloris sp. SCSIO W1101]|uniref:sugar phosphate nucleotidyltransferase n=1 Tax=Prosthecochloris sp. SCSIO W1101 TaxID=2992242 RepID=UPI002AC87377|nr:sugar phosphate nucleotidyltransferase [Prosthecochloris sp. SCSIO W1101]
MQFPVEHLYAVVMAGGAGGLMLWPYSRKKIPKQFVDVFGSGTMIESAITCVSGSVLPENIYVVTNVQGEMMMRRSLPWFPPKIFSLSLLQEIPLPASLLRRLT